MGIVDYFLANWVVLLGVPLIGGLIGWVTNYVAVKMLFHPRLPRRVLFVEFQGVFPKRQQAFAKKLGELVSEQLISKTDVLSTLHAAAESDRVRGVITTHIEDAITKKLPQAIPMIAMVLSPELVKTVTGVILRDMNVLINELVTEISGHVEGALDIHRLVEEKVAAFSSDRLEEVIVGIMKREFTFIEQVGGVLGFLIGVVQVILVELSRVM